MSIDWGSVPDWVVAATAAVGVGFGLKQLTALRSAERANYADSRAQVDIARAQLILAIDAEFESEAMVASRIAIRTLRNRAAKEARADLRTGASDADLNRKTQEVFSTFMTQLWVNFRTADSKDPSASATKPNDGLGDEAGSQYSQLTRLFGWMETVGRMAEQNLLPAEDMFELYDIVFIDMCALFRQHIEDRRTEGPNRNDRLWEKAIGFAEAAEHRRRALQLKAKSESNPASVSWTTPRSIKG